MIENYIWDFDGMLFDTYPHTVACFVETCRRKGRVIDPQEAYDKFKITMWDAFAYYNTDEQTKLDFYRLENDISFEPVGKPFELIPEILTFITQNGGRNFLFTHRDKVTFEYFEKYGLTRLFTGCVTSEMGFKLKPAPDAILYLIDRYSLDPGETAMLGDRPIDVQSGLNAGVAGILFDSDEKLRDTPCTFYTTTTGQIFDIVKNNLR